jgi:MoCo/4Fe-4S cofactor protein with predicted Tat translocation signal
MSEKRQLDVEEVRARLREARGLEYWRSLDEIADTEEFRELIHREFPQGATGLLDPLGRRDLLKLMGASLALAGVTACTRQPPEKIIPYVKQPEELVPGKPLYFATSATLGGYATGLLVESHEGRPTKIEGNPDHPASLGATDVFAQASVLGLYDPDRSQTITYLGEIQPWNSFTSAMQSAAEAKRGTQGAGLRILTGTVTSPTLASQLQQVLNELPSARWHQWEPVSRDSVRVGAKLAFGEVVDTQYRFDQARVILALDSDFLFWGPGAVRHAREFVDLRRAPTPGQMNRLYVVEGAVSITGQMADHRLPLKASEIEAFAHEVAVRLGVAGVPQDPSRLEWLRAAHPALRLEQWIPALVADLQRHPGASLVIVGDTQPATLHALAHAINDKLGNVGKTLIYTEPVEQNPVNQLDSLRQLAEDMEAGKVDLLFVLGSDPVQTAPADLRFADRMSKVALRVHLGLYHDETGALCHWHVPQAHELESWSDARAYDGTIGLIQPLIAPLYDGKSAHEVVGLFTKTTGQSGYDTIRAYWKAWYDQKQPGYDFEAFWRRVLHDGVVADTAAAPKIPSLGALTFPAVRPAPAGAGGRGAGGLEIAFRPDYSVFDGRFANNGWLQELPRPHTKLTWDNAAIIGPATAERLGLANDDVIELRYRGRVVSAPVWVLPGQPHDSVLVHLGYGRLRGGQVAERVGFDAYAIRTSAATWFDSGLEIGKTGQRHHLVSTQLEQMMEGRHQVRSATLDQYSRDPGFAHAGVEAPRSDDTLYTPKQYTPRDSTGYAWGMAIDLNACIGCNACVVACNAENNIAVVGKDQVSRGRKMHWIRIDRYYLGHPDNPIAFNQPVPCQQCENAPCELVCPVGATSHSAEGLNDMVYNRCVGTRYCSNNCPYKVRRFNFLLYQDWYTPSLKLMRNPDVTVRSRGVMEKCTYCVQRINTAKIGAEKEDRKVRDGDILTACQAACPAQAIVFGDINDPNSRVAKLKAGPRNYGLLEDLNTRPRTTYLAAVRNPNPEIPSDLGSGLDPARDEPTSEER